MYFSFKKNSYMDDNIDYLKFLIFFNLWWVIMSEFSSLRSEIVAHLHKTQSLEGTRHEWREWLWVIWVNVIFKSWTPLEMTIQDSPHENYTSWGDYTTLLLVVNNRDGIYISLSYSVRQYCISLDHSGAPLWNYHPAQELLTQYASVKINIRKQTMSSASMKYVYSRIIHTIHISYCIKLEENNSNFHYTRGIIRFFLVGPRLGHMSRDAYSAWEKFVPQNYLLTSFVKLTQQLYSSNL